jgi:multidrug resistance efflux pump
MPKIKSPKVLRVLVIIIVIALTISGYAYIQLTSGRVFIDNSLVSDPISDIAPANPGTLQEMDVYEGENVKKGQILAVIGGQPIYANEDGLIIQTNNQIGSIVSSVNPPIQMIDPSQMRIAGTIDENKGLSDIKVGQVVSFTIDALPGKTFWGYVDEIGPSAKQTALAFSISSERPTQQFVVYARFDSQKYPEIKNGMSAKMAVFTNTH